MPKIHRHRGVTTEVPIPSDPGVVDAEALEVPTDAPAATEPATEPGELVACEGGGTQIMVPKHYQTAKTVTFL